MDKDLQIRVLLQNIKLGYQNGMFSEISLNNYFGYVKETDIFDQAPFIDGYMQIELNDCKNNAESKYYHNYVTTNGKLVFDNVSRGAYIGRNIFLCIDDNDNYYICTPDKERKQIDFPYALLSSSLDSLIEKIVKELNIKYIKEANGIKYTPTKRNKKEWMLKNICGMEFNAKKIILKFVEEISEYDVCFPKYVYEYDRILNATRTEDRPKQKALEYGGIYKTGN